MNGELMMKEIREKLNGGNISEKLLFDITEKLSKKYNTTIKYILNKMIIVGNDIHNERVYGRELTEKIFKSIEEKMLYRDGDLTIVDGYLYIVDYYHHIITRIN